LIQEIRIDGKEKSVTSDNSINILAGKKRPRKFLNQLKVKIPEKNKFLEMQMNGASVLQQQ